MIMIALQMAIAKALLEFNDLGRSVTPTFLFRNRFYVQLSPRSPKMNQKISVGSYSVKEFTFQRA